MIELLARIGQADELLGEGDYKTAASIYADVLQDLPAGSRHRPAVLYNLGSCFEVDQRFGDAMELWQEALAILEAERPRDLALLSRVKASIASHENHPLAFVSYAHLDRDVVSRVVEELEHNGVYIVIDDRDLAAGKTVTGAIDDVMRRSPNVIIFWSAAYNGRPYTMHEFEAAVEAARSDKGRRAVIAKLDDEPLPESVAGMLFIPRHDSIEALAKKIHLALTARRS